MYMLHSLISVTLDERRGIEAAVTLRASERGSAVVEWLGISALSIGMLVGLLPH